MSNLYENAVPDVVISGIGGCYPHSRNIEDLKKQLFDQVNMIEPATWESSDQTAGAVGDMVGNLLDTHLFDSNFFGINSVLPDYMDPMARMLLEKSFEAITDAGIHLKEIDGRKIGVFMGSTIGENEINVACPTPKGIGIVGQSRNMAANRISYYLNLVGPSMSMDSTWLNGLEVIKLGYDLIKEGQIEGAIVGCLNFPTYPELTTIYNQFSFLNKDGKTKAFDDAADGYTRSGGICVLFLQRADLAKRNYATIMDCNVNINGDQSGSYTELKMDEMVKFLTNFYKQSKVDPQDVQFVETHGCGIKIVDEKELGAIDTVFNRNRDNPLLIGSVKSNLGHAEASASMLSIIKVLISMETGVIPGNLHYQTPNKNIPALANGTLQVVAANHGWTPSFAAVNGIGFANSFGHILLKANTRVKEELQLPIPMLHLISTRTEEGMQEIVKDIEKDPVVDPEYSRLLHDVFATTIPHHLYRAYVVHGKTPTDAVKHFPGTKRPIWFVYSGMGSQWVAMGKQLLNLPIFAASIEKSQRVLESKGLDIRRIITDDDPTIFDNILNCFVGIAAIQIALTDVLQAIGIAPDGIMGHSVGELGCAYADGCLTAEQVLLSAYSRGRASVEVELINGVMAAVGMGAKEIKTQCPTSIDIACHNGSNSCTLSGPVKEMTAFVTELQSKNIFAKLVNVANIAYHSRYIKPAAPLLLKYMKEIIPNPIARSKKWLSTSIVESDWGTDLAKSVSPEYLANNLLSTVYFEETSRHIPNNAVVIEIAPHGLLQAILRRSLSPDCDNVSLTKRDTDSSLVFFCTALGKLFVNGVDMNISVLYPHIEYPVARGTKSLATVIRWFHGATWRVEFKNVNLPSSDKEFAVNIKWEEFRHLLGHRIEHELIMPVTAFFPLICKLLNNNNKLDCILFEGITVKQHIVILEKDLSIRITLLSGTGNFEISNLQGLILLGRIILPENYKMNKFSVPHIGTEHVHCHLSEEDIQNELHYRGYHFSDVFNSVKQLKMYNEGSTAKIEWKNDWPSYLNAMLQVGMLHEEYNGRPIMPMYIECLLLNLKQLPDDRKDLNLSHHYKTKILTSSIAQIKGVTFKPYVRKDKAFIVESNNFRKYSVDTHDLQTEINVCLQIVQQHLTSKNPLYIITEIHNPDTKSLENNINYYSDRYFSSKIQLLIWNDTSKNIPSSTLTIIGEEQLQYVEELLKQTTEFILVSLPTNKQLSLGSTITSIRSFHAGKMQYHLLKQACDRSLVIINIISKSFNGTDLQNMSLPWVQQLYKSLDTSKEKPVNIYLVSTILPENGIELFLNDIQNLDNGSKIRLMFLLDENLPACTISTEFYQEMFQKNLPVTVFKDGNWGSYFKTPFIKLNNDKQIEDKNMITVEDLSNMFRDCNVKYLGLNVENICPNESMELTNLGSVEYSGYDKYGQRVMGIAWANLPNREMVPDPEFVWPIPENWTFMHGATSPYAYTCAYFVLFELVDLKKEDIVLIHNGCSSFALAALQVALCHGNEVYTTVGSDRQRESLLDAMPMLTSYQVMSYTTFEIEMIQKTKGKGANVVINCLSGEGLEASSRCIVNTGGRVVQMALTDADSAKTTGMRKFNYYVTAMYSFTPSLIFDKPRDVKLRIHAMVLDGLKKHFVEPLERTVVTQSNLDHVLRNLKNGRITGTAVLPIEILDQEKTPRIYKSTQFSKHACENNLSYIVYGEAKDMLMSIIHWLAMNGAKLIAVFSNVNLNLNFINSVKVQYNTDIQPIAYNVAQPSTTLRDVHEIKNIGAVLILSPLTPAPTTQSETFCVRQIDAELTALSSTAHLICFWSNQTCITYVRPNSLPVSNVKWEPKHEFSSVVRILDRILDEPADIDLRDDEYFNETNFLSKDFFVLLSKSQESIISTVNSASTATELIPLSTNTIQEIKETFPLFIVPGLLGAKCKFLQILLRKLLYPVYIINNGSSNNLETVAAFAVERIKQESQGPFNIVGISFGGALAIEIVRKLEEQGAETQLFLIDGVPDTIQHIMSENGSIEWIETSLLSSLLSINAPECIKVLENVSNWDTRIQKALQFGKYTKKESQKITRGLHVIKNKLNQVLSYTPYEKTISGTASFLSPQLSSQNISNILVNCCKQRKEKFFKGNHFTFLESDQLATYINENVTVPPFFQ